VESAVEETAKDFARAFRDLHELIVSSTNSLRPRKSERVALRRERSSCSSAGRVRHGAALTANRNYQILDAPVSSRHSANDFNRPLPCQYQN